jgi:hypothetical protein
MRQYSRWASAFLLLMAPLSALTQTHAPKLIDVHFHYDGEPGILEKLLGKLNAADGLAFLLTTPRGFPQASKFIHDHPDRFIHMYWMRSIASKRQDSGAWARLLPPSNPMTIELIGPSTIVPRSIT